ncbi:unnamed protein product, partial [Durusdinium trenchii]
MGVKEQMKKAKRAAEAAAAAAVPAEESEAGTGSGQCPARRPQGKAEEELTGESASCCAASSVQPMEDEADDGTGWSWKEDPPAKKKQHMASTAATRADPPDDDDDDESGDGCPPDELAQVPEQADFHSRMREFDGGIAGGPMMACDRCGLTSRLVSCYAYVEVENERTPAEKWSFAKIYDPKFNEVFAGSRRYQREKKEAEENGTRPPSVLLKQAKLACAKCCQDKMLPDKAFINSKGNPTAHFRAKAQETMKMNVARDKKLMRWGTWGREQYDLVPLDKRVLNQLTTKYTGAEDWVTMILNGRVAVLYACVNPE